MKRICTSLRLFIFLLFVILAGCQQSRQQFESTSPPMPNYDKPELLYLKANPCSRLYVEIQSVQGNEPKPNAIRALSEFLAKYCDKPDGIRIVQSPSIPRKAARDLPASVLALRYMRGPDKAEKNSGTAYLYVLIYDSGLKYPEDSSLSMSSYVPFSYPCAIFVDAAYWRPNTDTFMPRVLCHEASHIMGLTKRTDHGDGSHCKNFSCLMYPKHSTQRAFTVPGYNDNFDICRQCRQDIKHAKALKTDPRMNFHGPALVRRQGTYQIYLLPDVVYWDFSPFKPFDWNLCKDAALASWDKKGKRFSDRFASYRGHFERNEMSRFSNAVADSLDDPDGCVVTLAKRLSKNMETIYAQIPANRKTVSAAYR